MNCEMKPECIQGLKELKQYLNDSKLFFSKCSICPVAKKLEQDCIMLLEKLEKKHDPVNWTHELILRD